MLSFGEIHNSRHNLQEIITEKKVNKIRQQIKTPSLSDKRLQTNKSQLISSQLKFKNWPYWLLWSIKRWPPDSYCPTHSLKSSHLTAVKKLFLLRASLSETWPSAWRKTQWPRTCLYCTTYVEWLFVKMDWTYIKLECYNYISGLFSKGFKKLVANIFLAVVYDCILWRQVKI